MKTLAEFNSGTLEQTKVLTATTPYAEAVERRLLVAVLPMLGAAAVTLAFTFACLLRFKMSLVGPRLIAPNEADKFGKWQLNLLTVKPGTTGP